MVEVIGPFWTEEKQHKVKKYGMGCFWRFTAAISTIILVSTALTFVEVWSPFNWIINTIYAPGNPGTYAICGACVLWPLAVRLSQVSLSQIETKNNLIKKNPRWIRAGRLVEFRLTRLIRPVKGRG